MIFKKIYQLLVMFVISFIKVYQFLASPLLGLRCRFYPSCSEYAVQAIREQGLLYGLYLSTKRILCCHPWHPGGIHFVPKRDKKC